MMTKYPNWFEMTARQNFEDFVPKGKGNALQVGVFTGDATQWLIENTEMLITDVDTWAGSNEDAHDSMDFRDVERVYDSRFADEPRILKVVDTSDHYFATNGLGEWEGFDFIYIDGDHTAVQVALDGLNAFRNLKSGGVMGFDDLTWKSGKGDINDPFSGIVGFYNVVKSEIEVLAENSQFWIRRK